MKQYPISEPLGEFALFDCKMMLIERAYTYANREYPSIIQLLYEDERHTKNGSFGYKNISLLHEAFIASNCFDHDCMQFF